jgi:hypothetical protein
VFDDKFDTVQPNQRNKIQSNWQRLADLHTTTTSSDTTIDTEPDDLFDSPSVPSNELPDIPKGFRAPWYRTRSVTRHESETDPLSDLTFEPPNLNDDEPSSASNSPHGASNASDDVAGSHDPGNAASPHLPSSGPSNKRQRTDFEDSPATFTNETIESPASPRVTRSATLAERAREAPDVTHVSTTNPARLQSFFNKTYLDTHGSNAGYSFTTHYDSDSDSEVAPLLDADEAPVVTELRGEGSSFPCLQAHSTYMEHLESLPDSTFNKIASQHFAYASTKGDPDTLYLSEAKRQIDWPEFQKAMSKEVNDFNEREHWEPFERAGLAQIKSYDIVQAIWSFKRKRRPTGELLKYKARLCAHGGQQTQGVTYTDTYSPVVNWFTLRCFIVLALINNWKTRQVDFVLAFPQAELDANVFMELPFGFKIPDPGDWILRLKKNVYGLKDAGRTWFLHLSTGLTQRHFKPSEVDPCVFYKGDLILIVYVDDMICMCPTSEPIDVRLYALTKCSIQLIRFSTLGPPILYRAVSCQGPRYIPLCLPRSHRVGTHIYCIFTTNRYSRSRDS